MMRCIIYAVIFPVLFSIVVYGQSLRAQETEQLYDNARACFARYEQECAITVGLEFADRLGPGIARNIFANLAQRKTELSGAAETQIYFEKALKGADKLDFSTKQVAWSYTEIALRQFHAGLIADSKVTLRKAEEIAKSTWTSNLKDDAVKNPFSDHNFWRFHYWFHIIDLYQRMGDPEAAANSLKRLETYYFSEHEGVREPGIESRIFARLISESGEASSQMPNQHLSEFFANRFHENGIDIHGIDEISQAFANKLPQDLEMIAENKIRQNLAYLANKRKERQKNTDLTNDRKTGYRGLGLIYDTLIVLALNPQINIPRMGNPFTTPEDCFESPNLNCLFKVALKDMEYEDNDLHLVEKKLKAGLAAKVLGMGNTYTRQYAQAFELLDKTVWYQNSNETRVRKRLSFYHDMIMFDDNDMITLQMRKAAKVIIESDNYSTHHRVEEGVFVLQKLLDLSRFDEAMELAEYLDSFLADTVSLQTELRSHAFFWIASTHQKIGDKKRTKKFLHRESKQALSVETFESVRLVFYIIQQQILYGHIDEAKRNLHALFVLIDGNEEKIHENHVLLWSALSLHYASLATPNPTNLFPARNEVWGGQSWITTPF